MIVSIVIMIFVILELFNVLALYFKPDFDKANAMGPFKQWKEYENEPIADLLHYMAYWVAGSKLIFIFLLLIIISFGTAELQIISLVGLVIAILSYFWKLSPLMHKMDKDGHIIPTGYSKTLDSMIIIFVASLSVAGLLQFFFYW